MATKNNPGKFDCYSKADPDEPMFILLGRDPTAPLIVLAWAVLRHHCGHNDESQLIEAIECARSMQAWAATLGKRSLVDRARNKAATLLVQHAQNIIVDALQFAIEERLGDVPNMPSNGRVETAP
jgi:hypothetical protein